MNNSFSSPSFGFFPLFRSFTLLPFFTSVFHSSFSCQSWSLFLHFFLPFSSWCLHDFSFHSVWLGDLCLSHLAVWLNLPVCVVEDVAVIRMIISHPPLSRGAESQFIIKFLHHSPRVCLLKWPDRPYLLNNSTLLGKVNVSLWCECIYEFLIFAIVSSCWNLVYKLWTDQEECEAPSLRPAWLCWFQPVLLA